MTGIDQEKQCRGREKKNLNTLKNSSCLFMLLDHKSTKKSVLVEKYQIIKCFKAENVIWVSKLHQLYIITLLIIPSGPWNL